MKNRLIWYHLSPGEKLDQYHVIPDCNITTGKVRGIYCPTFQLAPANPNAWNKVKWETYFRNLIKRINSINPSREGNYRDIGIELWRFTLGPEYRADFLLRGESGVIVISSRFLEDVTTQASKLKLPLQPLEKLIGETQD